MKAKTKKRATRNGRDARGRFAPGNAAARGHGNPHAARVAKLRAALLKAITPEKITQTVLVLHATSVSGRVPHATRIEAARLLLDRVFGPATALDLDGEADERLAALEAVIEKLAARLADEQGEGQ